jgi:hypothetical protein
MGGSRASAWAAPAIGIDRPKKRNRFSPKMLVELSKPS